MSKVQTGPRTIFRLGNEKVAYASNASWEENIKLDPVEVLDKLDVEEFAETGYSVSMTCESFRVAKKSVKQLGIMPTFSKILSQGELTAEVVDRVTGATLLLMTGVKLQGRSTRVGARDIMTETWTFVGKKAEDEAGA
jgi:hypothetical protein